MAGKGKRRFQGPAGGGPSMMRKIEQLQAQMDEAQTVLAASVVVGTAGGGAVSVEMTGSQELRSITIQREAVDPEDVEMLQDLIALAFRDAQLKVHALTEERMAPFAAGMNVPGLL
jgi:DNA-binding YbaB/EbfC family protein